jgi:hypothetical protein
MFWNKVSHVESKKDEVVANMVLTIERKSKNPRLVPQWEKEEHLQKTFELVI